jgi:hypothetical protein
MRILGKADIGASEGPRESLTPGRRTLSYRIVLQSGGLDIETLYWSGSFGETRVLARQIASKCGADAFRIFDFSCGDSEVCLERGPFGGAGGDC